MYYIINGIFCSSTACILWGLPANYTCAKKHAPCKWIGQRNNVGLYLISVYALKGGPFIVFFLQRQFPKKVPHICKVEAYCCVQFKHKWPHMAGYFHFGSLRWPLPPRFGNLSPSESVTQKKTPNCCWVIPQHLLLFNAPN